MDKNRLDYITENYKSPIFQKMMIQKELLEKFDNQDKITSLYQETINDNLQNDLFMEDYYTFCFDNMGLLNEETTPYNNVQQPEQGEDVNIMKKDIVTIKKYLQQQQWQQIQTQKKQEEIRKQQNSPKTIGIKLMNTVLSAGVSMWLYQGGFKALANGFKKESKVIEISGSQVIEEIEVSGPETVDATYIQPMQVNPQAVSMASKIFSGLLGLIPGLGSSLGVATVIGIAVLIWGSIAVTKSFPTIRNKQDKIKANIIKLTAAIKKGDELAQRTHNIKVIKRWSRRKMKLMKKLEVLKLKTPKQQNNIK